MRNLVVDVAGGKKAGGFENMVLRRIFGPRRDEVMGSGGDCIMRN